jgi:release factor glutamine methyltransferase
VDVEEARRGRPRLTPVALSLWSIAEGARLSSELRDAGVPVMLLKGPRLQERLYGTPAAYVSSDVDVLVPRNRAREARAALTGSGWTFEPENGMLWFLSAAASFERSGFRADLHWGLHAAHLPSLSLRSLERDLWHGALPGPDGYLVPDNEALFVYLAVHAVGHRFERPHWVENVFAAAANVRSWDRVWHIAAAARVTDAVRAAMEEREPGSSTVVLDGVLGRAIWYSTYALRGHAFPTRLRGRVRELQAMRREGFGWRGVSSRTVSFGDLRLRVDAGVFDPQPVSLRLIAAAIERGVSAPEVIVDVGTGCGAIALSAAGRWPDATVLGLDVSSRAIRCARRNARRLSLDVRFELSDLLRDLPRSLRGKVDLLFSNIPYISPASGRDMGEWRVPSGTVYGPGNDGLGLMRQLAMQAEAVLAPAGLWVFQMGDSQWEAWSYHLSGLGFGILEPSERRPGGALVAGAIRKS